MSYPKYRAAGIVVGSDWDALTRTVLSYGGATAVVGFKANLTGRENYFLCDGTADDIQLSAAKVYVDALGGGFIECEGGTYDITSSINITEDSVSMRGMGHGTASTHGVTKFRQANATNLTYILQASGDNIHLENIFIDGNKANNTGSTDGFRYTSTDGEMIYCTAMYCDGKGMVIGGLQAMYFAHCFSELNDSQNFNIKDTRNSVFMNLYSAEAGASGYYIYELEDSYFYGCVSHNDVDEGYWVDNSLNLTFIGCHYLQTNDARGEHGVKITRSTLLNFTDWMLVDPGRKTHNTYDGFRLESLGGIHCTYITIKHCRIQSTQARKMRYGISEQDANQDYNTILRNTVIGFQTAIASLHGLNDKLLSKTFQFTEPLGTAAWQVASPTGILVDAAAEGALALGESDQEVQMVVRFRVKGVGLGAPGAGKGMLLEININAGKPTGHEPYNAEVIACPSIISTEDNFAVDDAIEWIIDPSDDVDIDDIGPGETIEMFAMFEDTGANGDIATNAVLRTISMEYV